MKRILLLSLLFLLLTACDSKIKSDRSSKEIEIIETEITEDMNNKIDRFIEVFQYKYIDIFEYELPTNEKMYYAFVLSKKANSKNVVSRDDLNNMMIELFGQKVEYSDENIKSIFTDETIAYYKDDNYFYNVDTSHGVPMVRANSYEVSRTRKNSRIVVELKRVYIKCGGDVCPVANLYKDPEYKEEYDVPKKYCVIDEYNPNFCDINVEEYLNDNYKDIISLYYEFEIEDNNIIFKRIYR